MVKLPENANLKYFLAFFNLLFSSDLSPLIQSLTAISKNVIDDINFITDEKSANNA